MTEDQNFDMTEDVKEDDVLDRFFKSPVEFSLYIEQRAIAKGMEILEFLSEYVVENSIDEESIPPLLTEAIKQKIMAEAKKKYIMSIDNDETELEF